MDRRLVCGGIFASLAGGAMACASALTSAPDLVAAFDPQRQTRLFPAEPPFAARYARRGRVLWWLAVRHAASPDDPNSRFVAAQIAKMRPAAVLLEGVPTAWGRSPERLQRSLASRPAAQDNEGDVAARAGLAVGAALVGGEPEERDRVAALRANGFQPLDVQAAAYFGPLEQDQRAGAIANLADPRLEAVLARWTKTDVDVHPGLAPLTATAFRAWAAAQFGPEVLTEAAWYERGWPAAPTLAGAIARASNLLRDRHLYATALALAESDRRVVAVYGASHWVNLADALAASFGRPRFALASA